MERVRERFTRSVILSINMEAIQEQTIGELRKVAEKHKGKCACVFTLINREQEKPIRLQSTKYNVDASDAFVAAVEDLLGSNSVKFSN